MATCTLCGKWAGIGQSKHEPSCVPLVSTQRIELSPVDELVMKLTPVLMAAAKKAAYTVIIGFVLVSAVAGILLAMLR